LATARKFTGFACFIKIENPVVETTGCKPKPTAYEKNLEFIFCRPMAEH
jgi:hypothetical protein